MATDYDAPRRTADDDIETESLEGLQAAERADAVVDDTDDGEIVEPFDVPLADLSGEEFSAEIKPRMSDEFTCSVCFLVQHRSRLAEADGEDNICSDCA